MSSSILNVIAASGVLNAAASPAEAPMAVAARRCRLGEPVNPDKNEAIPLPINTVGPSLPRLAPPPILTIPVKNFTITVLKGI